ncbi:unnamed protein product [Lathyrus sativus]|nr:unnamed protein product [Lathyrus sativus]
MLVTETRRSDGENPTYETGKCPGESCNSDDGEGTKVLRKEWVWIEGLIKAWNFDEKIMNKATDNLGVKKML